MNVSEIDEAKLEAFMGQAMSDMGAIISAPLMMIGEKLGSLQGDGPCWATDGARDRGSGPARPSATCASGSATRRPAATSPTTPIRSAYTLPDEHALALADEDSPFYILGVLRLDRLAVCRRGSHHRRFRTGAGHGLARARPPPVPRNRALLPAWLPRPSCERVDSRARRRTAEAGTRRQGRRRRLRTRSVNVSWPRPSHARSSSGSTITPRRSRARARPPRKRASMSRITFAVASAKEYPGPRLRPGVRVRLPARHGRSGRRRGARSETLDARWDVDDRRAVRGRSRSRKTSTRLGGSSTGHRPSSARRRRSRRRWAWRSARRPARRDSHPC